MSLKGRQKKERERREKRKGRKKGTKREKIGKSASYEKGAI